MRAIHSYKSKDPGFVGVSKTVKTIKGDEYTWGEIQVVGPRGLVVYDCDDKEAEKVLSLLNFAFDAGRKWEQDKQDQEDVPGPQDPPRPIHRREWA